MRRKAEVKFGDRVGDKQVYFDLEGAVHTVRTIGRVEKGGRWTTAPGNGGRAGAATGAEASQCGYESWCLALGKVVAAMWMRDLAWCPPNEPEVVEGGDAA
jgi:hypothetical protein